MTFPSVHEFLTPGDPPETGRMLHLLQDKGGFCYFHKCAPTPTHVPLDFLLQETIALDDMGVKHATRSKKGKGKEIKSKARKNVQKILYVFNKNILRKREYLDYFEPDDMDLAMRLMGITTEVLSTTTYHDS